jgi:hypothetical protein
MLILGLINNNYPWTQVYFSTLNFILNLYTTWDMMSTGRCMVRLGYSHFHLPPYTYSTRNIISKKDDVMIYVLMGHQYNISACTAYIYIIYAHHTAQHIMMWAIICYCAIHPSSVICHGQGRYFFERPWRIIAQHPVFYLRRLTFIKHAHYFKLKYTPIDVCNYNVCPL